MNTTANADWREDFGLGQRRPPCFFANREDLSGASPAQSHILRRAFDLFDLDGAFCAENSPLVYFKQVRSASRTDIDNLHRRFWNHGGAPILVLITPAEVRVLSSMASPEPRRDAGVASPGLVQVIQRTSAALHEFLLAVESGEFFRRHARSFNPQYRVDRCLLDNLQATRENLAAVSARSLAPQALDAILCRLVFTCYLFDRKVIGSKYLSSVGVKGASHLRDVLAIHPRSTARDRLYSLFSSLEQDFNGDLFSDDLQKEAGLIGDAHIDLLERFFKATDVEGGQQSFWPYDFGVIPVETISAIYERFLKEADRNKGAFYTPRFLAEAVLDVALMGTKDLLGTRSLDPACGSGIFLVGLFNRMAEEWKRANPGSRNDRRARELMKMLQSSLFGVDVNPTACRITAFSLYLAYLDQLSPRDIRELQHKGRALPRLVGNGTISAQRGGCVIWCADFFTEGNAIPMDVDLVLGNPPWGSIAAVGTPAANWCAKHSRPIPDNQIATAFIWKAPEHVRAHGKVCFILPHGTLFNHNAPAVDFQCDFIHRHAVDYVLNLADFRSFLFEKAHHPAIVISYRKEAPVSEASPISYWAPKANWIAAKAEIISVAPEDINVVTVGEVLHDLVLTCNKD